MSGSGRPSVVGQFEPSAYGRKAGARSVAGSSFAGPSRNKPKQSASGWAKPPKGPVEETIPFAEEGDYDDDDDEDNDTWGKVDHAPSDDDSD